MAVSCVVLWVCMLVCVYCAVCVRACACVCYVKTSIGRDFNTVKVSAMHAGGLYMYIVIAEEADKIQYLYLTGNALMVYVILSCWLYIYIQEIAVLYISVLQC